MDNWCEIRDFWICCTAGCRTGCNFGPLLISGFSFLLDFLNCGIVAAALLLHSWAQLVIYHIMLNTCANSAEPGFTCCSLWVKLGHVDCGGFSVFYYGFVRLFLAHRYFCAIRVWHIILVVHIHIHILALLVFLLSGKCIFHSSPILCSFSFSIAV